MKKTLTFSCCIVTTLVLLMAAPVTAESSVISSISPSVAYLGSSSTVTITGTDFNTSSVKVKLIRTDESNITATVSSQSSTTIVCRFTISSSKTTGSWDVVVVNEDDSEVVKVDGFTLRSAVSLTSISPTEGRTNNDAVDFTLAGTGLANVDDVYLYNSDHSNVSASLSDTESTEVTGSFSLTDVDEDTYKVCVLDSAGTRKCGLSFEVTTDQLGSIDISSSPTGASVYVDSRNYGTTPCEVTNMTVGSHKVILQKSGYTEWGKIVKVTAEGTTTVDATLGAITTAPTPLPAAPVPTTMPTTEPTAVKTIKKPVTTAATPWPTATPTQESPVGIFAILGGVGLAIAAMRK